MPESAKTLQDALDDSKLDGRYWTFFSMVSLSSVIDFFDFFIAAFLLSVVAPLWQLTYGETAIILLGAGAGSIVGSLLGGYLCDKVGRRPVVIYGSLICSVFAALISLIPDGAWVEFALLRFLTGICISAVFAAIIAVTVERTPIKHRTVVTSLAFVAPSAGVMLAAVTSAFLLELLGWRGVALLGALPIIPGLLAIVLLPESIPWLMSTGKEQQARELASKQLGSSVDDLVMPEVKLSQSKGLGIKELYGCTRSFWLVVIMWFGTATALYGVYSWGPMIITLTQNVSAQTAARMFIAVSLAGICGKIFFSLVPRWLGRLRTGQITTVLAATALVVVAFVPSTMPTAMLFGFPVFMVFLVICSFGGEGCAAGLSPYSAEVFPVRLAARGAGLGQAAAGMGKIIGPISLGVIAGTGNLVTPQATSDAVLPGFLFLAACFGITTLAFTFLGIETHGRRLELDSLKEPEPKAV